MRTPRFSPKATAAARSVILLLAPLVAMIGHGSHPWIGSPGDPEFLVRLAAAVTTDVRRWTVSHLMIGIGSGLLVIAFLAVRSYLRDVGEHRWSAIGVPFIVLGSTLYAMLPAIEFAPVGAYYAGADVAAIQSALMPLFVPILQIAAALFALGVLGFVLGIARSHAFTRGTTWVVVGALILMAVTRFFPVGAAQLYVGPAAAIVALWPLAYAVRRRTRGLSGAPTGEVS